jgi:hypothetical protein
MTPYELMDLRATTSDTYWTILRSWLTVTFASFSAANFITGGANPFTYVLLLFFYGSVTAAMLIYLEQIKKEVEAVESDLMRVALKEESDLALLRPSTIKSRVMMVKFQRLMGVAVTLIFAGYLWLLYAYSGPG